MANNTIDARLHKPASVLIVTRDAVNSLKGTDRIAAEALLRLGRWKYANESDNRGAANATR